MTKFSILIPTLRNRTGLLNTLIQQFHKIGDGLEYKIETLPDDGEATTGAKRTHLLKNCTSDYFAFFDDDDWPYDCYLTEIFKGIESGADVMGINGIISWQRDLLSGAAWRKHWKIYLDCPRWEDKNSWFHRWPNHITPMKTELVQDIAFPNLYSREDYMWSCEVMGYGKDIKNMEKVAGKIRSTFIFDADPLKPIKVRGPRLRTEYTIQRPIYHYRCVDKK